MTRHRPSGSRGSQLTPVDPFDLYLREICGRERLTRADEAHLGQAIHAGRRARVELAAGKRLSRARRHQLEVAATTGKEAHDRFIEANLHLVVSVAKRYRSTGLPLADLVGHGNVGLIHAIDKFDWRRGFRFSTYGVWWIRESITRWVQTSRSVVRIPVHVGEALGQLRRAQRHLEVHLGRVPSEAELGQALGASILRIRELLGYGTEPMSLYQPIDEADRVIADTVADPASAVGFDKVLTSTLASQVRRMLAVLSPREQTVLSLRFGLAEDRPHTQEEIGRRIGLTRERARQIEAQALEKLRDPAVGADRWRELIVG